MVGSRRGYLLSRGSSLEHLCDAYVVFDTWTNYCTMVGSCYSHMILNRSDLGIQGYSMLTLEEYTLWLNSRWPQSGPFILWCDVTVTTQEQQWTTKCVYGNASYGSLRLCFYGSLWLDFFAFAKRGLDFDWWPCDSIRNLRTNNYMLKVLIMIGSVVWRATLCRRVCFPMGAYGAGTLKQTVSLGWKSFFVWHELPTKNKHDKHYNVERVPLPLAPGFGEHFHSLATSTALSTQSSWWMLWRGQCRCMAVVC
jgi:hypothetical protein